MPSNDNDADRIAPTAGPGEAHGQAALILVESLIHGLMARSILTADDSFDIVTSAIDVQADYAADEAGSSGEMRRSHALLSSIAGSLKTDPLLSPELPGER